jgi:hypothetical protein
MDGIATHVQYAQSHKTKLAGMTVRSYRDPLRVMPLRVDSR